MEKNNDKVFLKTKYDGIWEDNPTIAFAIYLFVYLILFFCSIFLYAFFNVYKNLPGIILAIWLILLSVGMLVMSLYLNETRNMSKSTGFVKRDGMLYLIKLGYVLGLDIDTPPGSRDRAIIYEAAQVQQAEQEVRDRRVKPQAYIDVLDCKLNSSKKKGYLPKGCIGFILLDKPKIEKQNKNFIWISYKKGKERKIKKIRNAYDGLAEEINNSLYSE